jgi:glycosyltransferase involved in cell wall biosynthesis
MTEIYKIPAPQISVVIPTRDRYDLLQRAIRSVLEQTVRDFEVIVVDDASIEDVGAIIGRFADARLTLVRHQIPMGGGASRNTGIRHASGKYVAFLDDDDEWLPEKLELQLVRINSYDNPGLVYTGSFHIDQRTGLTLKVFRPRLQHDTHRHLLRKNVIGTTSSIMVRRTNFSAGLMFDEHLRSCQDWDLYLKITNHCSVGCIDRPLVKYHMHDTRITRNYIDVLQGHKAILDTVVTQYNPSRTVISYHHFKIGKLALQFGDKKTGRQELLHSLSLSPWSGPSIVYLLASFLHNDLYQKGSHFFQRLKIRIASFAVWFVHNL